MENVMSFQVRTLKVSATGSAGSASGNSQEAVPSSKLYAVYFDFHGSAPATLDTTLSTPGNSDLPSQTILTLTNVNTDGYYYPRRQIDDNVGAAVTGAYDPFYLSGSVRLVVAQGDALTDIVIAHLIIEVP